MNKNSNNSKDLQSIIKKVAERYGLHYDETKKYPTAISKNGTITVISKEKFLKAFELYIDN